MYLRAQSPQPKANADSTLKEQQKEMIRESFRKADCVFAILADQVLRQGAHLPYPDVEPLAAMISHKGNIPLAETLSTLTKPQGPRLFRLRFEASQRLCHVTFNSRAQEKMNQMHKTKAIVDTIPRRVLPRRRS